MSKGRMGEDYKYISGGKVLFVDERVDLCLLLKAYFLRKGYCVCISHTLDDALRSAADFHPDTVIMNLSPSDEKRFTMQRILEHAPDVRLIIIDGEVTYNRGA